MSLNKNLYAITVNPNHEIYNTDIQEVATAFTFKTLSSYLLVAQHGKTTGKIHYHMLTETNKSLEDLKDLKFAHIEPVRNPVAYKKYMLNHDLIDKLEIGEMEFHEQDNLIDYAMVHGVVKTVQKYGMIALRYYSNLKKFVSDYESVKGHIIPSWDLPATPEFDLERKAKEKFKK